jgi:uncharacterized protein (DUF302 family)
MGTSSESRYGYVKRLRQRTFAEAKAQVTDALKREGFGVITEIDVKATLKEKLNQDFRQYVILGACNPQLAHRALEGELAIGLLLPCNVCVWDDTDGVTVAMVRPDAMFEVVDNPVLDPIAREADERLRRALDALN